MLAQRASSLPVAPAFPPPVASPLHSAALTAHPGGKKPTPQAGQVPYVRVSFTASPPVVWIQRVCSPRAHNGLREDRTRRTLLLWLLAPVLTLTRLHQVLEQLGP